MGPQAEIISGPKKPNDAAWIIHYPIHRANQDAKCVLHAHPPYSTALSMRKDGMLDTRCCQAAAAFHDDVAYFDLYDGILRAEEEGDRMAEILGEKRVLMMRNHGLVVTGKNVGARLYVALRLGASLQVSAARQWRPRRRAQPDPGGNRGPHRTLRT